MVVGKFNDRADSANSLLCVGLDSHYESLPAEFQSAEHPQFAFNKHIISLTHEYVAAYKPNIAFYEARGDAGYAELKMTMDFLRARHPDIFTICDCKRGDTDNTSDAYATSLFDWFGFDAVTLHPYMGQESLMPFLKRTDKASIILCRTSNPGAPEFQNLLVGSADAPANSVPLWQDIAKQVAEKWNTNGNCMMVVGATYPEEMKEVREIAGDMTFLVPGVGSQGGDVEKAVRAGLNSEKKGMIINAARSVIFSDDPAKEAMRLRDEINQYRT